VLEENFRSLDALAGSGTWNDEAEEAVGDFARVSEWREKL
jgi:hypothetical protein